MYAIIDVETTGFQPAYDKILEVAILVYDGKQILDRFATLINPEIKIPSNIARMLGIDVSAFTDAPQFYEIARRIVEMTEGKIIVGHNVRFDHAFLKREFRSLGYRFHRKQLCTLRLSRTLLPALPTHRLSRCLPPSQYSN